MADDSLAGRLARLSPEQRRLLELKLKERGFAPDAGRDAARSPGAAAGDAEISDVWRERPPLRQLDLSLYFFSDDGSKATGDKYRLTLESARFADERGFAAVWTPERHFQPFGGLYPNPSVLGAAIAAITDRVGVRAGSVALPLHNPIRVAEEWSVVDNISNGRAGVSFASGWHPNDFVLTPTSYEERKETMFRAIETIRRLWAGEAVSATAADGREVEVRTLPRPIQRELPVWVTTAGNPETWRRAAAIGANVLAALVGTDAEELAALVRDYRAARAAAGHDPRAGTVTIVVHTYVGRDTREVKELVRAPMTAYLRTYMKQFERIAIDPSVVAERDAEEVAALAFEHYFHEQTLLGTQAKCARVLDALASCDVDEAACLVDFGLDSALVLEALPLLDELRAHYAGAGQPAAARS